MPVKRSPGSKMTVVSVHIPEKWIEILEELVREGYFPTIREAIRYSLYELLVKVITAKSCGNKVVVNVEEKEEMEILRGRI
jgi:Arc/MetJ-type ribon-helix-helix transcriptional regulator